MIEYGAAGRRAAAPHVLDAAEPVPLGHVARGGHDGRRRLAAHLGARAAGADQLVPGRRRPRPRSRPRRRARRSSRRRRSRSPSPSRSRRRSATRGRRSRRRPRAAGTRSTRTRSSSSRPATATASRRTVPIALPAACGWSAAADGTRPGHAGPCRRARRCACSSCSRCSATCRVNVQVRRRRRRSDAVRPGGRRGQPAARAASAGATRTRPSALKSEWQPGAFGGMTKGAIMAFENNHDMTADGVAGAGRVEGADRRDRRRPEVDLRLHVRAGQRGDPESEHDLAQRQDGRHRARQHRHPGRADGDRACSRCSSTCRRRRCAARTRTASHYADPGIPWVSYFNGGDALHGFIRASYGFPQSHGCVEMPYSEAAQVWPYTPIGTLGRRLPEQRAWQPDWRRSARRCRRRIARGADGERAQISRRRGRAGAATRSTPTCAGARSPRRPRARTRSTRSSSPRWASERGLEPATIDVRALRRYVAGLSERGQAPATVARKLASLRGLFRALGRARRARREPRRAADAPKRAQRLPRVLKPTRSRRCSTGSRRRRRWSCATARCSSSPTPRGCAPRSS